MDCTNIVMPDEMARRIDEMARNIVYIAYITLQIILVATMLLGKRTSGTVPFNVRRLKYPGRLWLWPEGYLSSSHPPELLPCVEHVFST